MSGHPEPDPPGPGQESVWDYPRPAICEPTERHIQIIHRGVTLVDSRNVWRTLETSHPPTYYIPQSDIAMEHLVPNARRTLCEWKGQARYFDILIGDDRIEAGAWSYSSPTPSFAPIRDHLAFYPDPLDQCHVDGETITPQPGQFYGGWISQYEAGPYKGVPGSRSGEVHARRGMTAAIFRARAAPERLPRTHPTDRTCSTFSRVLIAISSGW